MQILLTIVFLNISKIFRRLIVDHLSWTSNKTVAFNGL